MFFDLQQGFFLYQLLVSDENWFMSSKENKETSKIGNFARFGSFAN